MSDDEVFELNQFEALIQGLIDDQYGCCNDFLLPATIAGLRMNMTTLSAAGVMKAAGIGNKLAFKREKSIRGDKVNWILDQSTNPFEVIYLRKIWRFVEYLNKTCFTSLKSFESHYAHFELGGFYKRHFDQFKSEKGRKYSIVLYLNQDWREEDDGMLSLYPSSGGQKNISPVEGRMVFFRSDEMEHEVHPSLTRERRSIAGWLKN
ncbi:MAG: SM-20-related protein [Algoriphagus sp.]|jgi:SM-20-related protein